jgi:hypothetical protein
MLLLLFLHQRRKRTFCEAAAHDSSNTGKQNDHRLHQDAPPRLWIQPPLLFPIPRPLKRRDIRITILLVDR